MRKLCVLCEFYAFWLCFLALNQHRAGEEVGETPEDGGAADLVN